jgi:hypothetical protein
MALPCTLLWNFILLPAGQEASSCYSLITGLSSYYLLDIGFHPVSQWK